MKKLLWLLGALFIVLVVAVVSVPLFVDVDQYRPVIVEEANKRINGKVELGKLDLSLWGAIKVNAESIKLSVNGYPGSLLDTREFHLEIPYFSVLTMRPKVIAVFREPKISVVKNENGKMNVLELMKTAEAPASQGADKKAAMVEDEVSTTSAATEKSEPTKVPALLAGASLGLRIEKGDLHYQDAVTRADYKVEGLDLLGNNLGLGSAMDLKVKAPLKGATPTLSFQGPVEAAAEITPVLVGGDLRGASGTIDVDAAGLAIQLKSGAFKKESGVPLSMKAKFDGNEKETLIQSLEARLAGYKVHGKGRATVEPVTVKLDVNADPMRLDDLAKIVPMAAEYQLKGTLNFNATVDQDPKDLRINGDLKLTDGSVFLKEFLQAPLALQVQAGFSESTLNLVRAGVSGPDSELQLQGTVKNFLAPQFSLNLTGKSFNVDKTVVLPDTKTASAERSSFSLVATAVAQDAKEKAPVMVNPLAALARNPVVAKANGVFNAQIGRVTVKGANLENVVLKSRLNPNLKLGVEDASLKTFGGTVKAGGNFDLGSPRFEFSSKGQVANISAKDAFAQYFPKYKNTLEGQVDATWNVNGALYPEPSRMRSLGGTAKLVAQNGVLRSIDFQDTINSTMQKIPFLKEKRAIEIDDGFKSLKADLRFQNGEIKVEPIEVEPRGKGFVVKGKSTIQENLTQESFFDIYDPHGKLPKEISQPGKVAIALHLTGPLSAPKTDYDYTVKKLASTAGKAKAKEALGKFLGGSDNGKEGEKKDPLKGLGDKLKKKIKLF